MEERKKEEVELGLEEMEEEMERREKEDVDLELEEVEAVGWRVDLFYVLLRLCCFFVFVLFFWWRVWCWTVECVPGFVALVFFESLRLVALGFDLSLFRFRLLLVACQGELMWPQSTE